MGTYKKGRRSRDALSGRRLSTALTVDDIILRVTTVTGSEADVERPAGRSWKRDRDLPAFVG
ncbi:hypothetical protein K8S17_00645 [bacterium]|nr:hypothetical protein [bacterium]